MSLDLFQQEGNERLTALPPVQNVDPGMFDGFVRGTGLATMKGFAKAARAVDLIGSVGPIVQDAFTGGTEAQDKYFAEHDAIFGRAVDYWTPRSNEIGMAGEMMGGLLSVIPQVIASPSLAVATTQLGTAEDLANVGVTTGKAQIVGAVQGLTLGTGIWMPILGKNLWQRAVIGGAGFNLAQGTVARGVSGAILEGTPAAEMFKAFDGEAMTLDVLMGLAFGGLVHYSPTQRAQGAKAWESIGAWAKNLNPSDKAAIVTLREAQHLNLDSTPGKPVSDVDIEAHVNRMRTAIDQIASDKPVAVEDITVPRRSADIGEAPAEVRAMFEKEQQLRQEWEDAENSRGDAMERGDQEAIATWDGELQRIATDLQDVSTKRTELWAAEELDTQPRFEPDPERTAQAEATMRDLAADAETIRAEDGIPPPPVEPPRVVQSVRRTIEEQLVQAGRPAEEATAGAAIWDAFYNTMAKRLGTTADELWSRFPLARITKDAPGTEALKQGPNGDPVITVAGKDRPITNAEGKRIAADVEELKAFWNWFKDSKVIAADGKPLVVYHGTGNLEGMEAFNPALTGQGNDQIGSGFYFTTNKTEASGYAAAITQNAPLGATKLGGDTSPGVVPAYLSIKKPIKVNGSTLTDTEVKLTAKQSAAIIKRAPGVRDIDETPIGNFVDVWATGKVTDAMIEEAAKSYVGPTLMSLEGDFFRNESTAFREAVRDILGYDGVTLTFDNGTTHYVAWFPEQIKSAIGNRGTFDPKNPDILSQKTKGTERGYMSIGDEGRIIGLLEGADASTFVHESGHFFLDTMADIGRLPDVPDAVRADLDTALGWMGVKDPAKWADMSLDEKRPYHEKFARGFEKYLRDGEAPSAELKGVFQRFRDWLVEIYKSAKSLNVKLNDDIRGVLNRMLADQTRNPSTEAPPAPSERTGSPPPPRSGGEAQAGAEVPLIDQPPIRIILQGLADNETGWAQIGGKLMDQSELGTGKPSFTTWIPKAEWWRDRPDKKMNGPQAQEAVRKALAGEKLKPIEQRMIDFMLTMADERYRGIDQVGGADEYDALALNAYDEGLEPTTQNVVDLDLVARAAALDEAAVERAALMYENDDAAFRGELEMIIYEAESTQATETAGRSPQGEPAQGQGETRAKEPDAIRDAADRIVAEQPDMLITIGKNPDGTSMTMRAADFLEQERAIADAARDDVRLFEAAATCLFGG